jgi:hypothetical protein
MVHRETQFLQVLQLQAQVASLKQLLREYAGRGKVDDQDPELPPDVDPFMSLGQDFERDQKSIVLSQEIKSLKHESKMLQVQLTKQKQAQIGLEKRLTTTEDAHKATKANLASANQNMQEMVGIYPDKLRQIKEE